MKFFVNKSTGAFATSCCGDLNDGFTELKANDTDAAVEKHVPVVNISGNVVSVCVGEVAHPMTAEHSITNIILETSDGYQVKKLAHTGKPKAKFVLADGEKAIAVYEYCNLHGLWVKKL